MSFLSKRDKQIKNGLIEFSDKIFSEENNKFSLLRREFVAALEEEEFALLSDGIYFRVLSLEDGGAMLQLSEDPKDEEAYIKIYVNKEDAVDLYYQVNAIRDGMNRSIDITNKANDYIIRLKSTISDVYSIEVIIANKQVMKVSGTSGIFQKLFSFIF